MPFKPGVSANPGGRPTRLSTIRKEVIQEFTDVVLRTDLETETITGKLLGTRQYAAELKKIAVRNPQIYLFLLNHRYGKPTENIAIDQKTTFTIDTDLKEAIIELSGSNISAKYALQSAPDSGVIEGEVVENE